MDYSWKLCAENVVWGIADADAKRDHQRSAREEIGAERTEEKARRNAVTEQENRRERDARRRPHERREPGHRIERQSESRREHIERGQPQIECHLARTVGHDPNPAESFTGWLCD